MDKLNERKLLEALVGYGEWGDRNFPDDHDFHQDLIETLSYKVSLLEKIYNKGEEVSGSHPLMRYLFDLGDGVGDEFVDVVIAGKPNSDAGGKAGIAPHGEFVFVTAARDISSGCNLTFIADMAF